jgi:polar amino acid transport system ATP-binding protein
MPLLALQKISVSINGNLILRDVSVDIQRGLVTTIIGPSGGGKTTLLRTINLLRIPDQGRIVFDGRVVFDASDTPQRTKQHTRGLLLNGFSEAFKTSAVADSEYRRHFGMVFQDYNLWPNLTIYDNIAAPLRWSLHLSESEIRNRVDHHAGVVKIKHILQNYPSEASGGERQRAAIARALVSDPDILLLDEVTSALDVELASEVLKLILLLKDRGHTMVLVTHHLHFAQRISDYVLFLARGTIVERGPAASVFSAPTDSELRQFLEYLRL